MGHERFPGVVSPEQIIASIAILDINIIVTPPNSNAFSDWRRTRHMPWVKSL